MSIWAGRVGVPVLGPPRCTSTTTHGTSAMTACPRFSCLRLKPGPDVAVSALAPAREAPMMAPIAAISSSIWMNLPPIFGSLRTRYSAISEEGVMG